MYRYKVLKSVLDFSETNRRCKGINKIRVIALCLLKTLVKAEEVTDFHKWDVILQVCLDLANKLVGLVDKFNFEINLVKCPINKIDWKNLGGLNYDDIEDFALLEEVADHLTSLMFRALE